MSITLMTQDLPGPLTAADPIVLHRWRAALPTLAVALLLLLGLYWQTAVSIGAIWWRSATFAHGMLVIPIVLFMIWTRRHSLAWLPPRSDYLGLAVLLLACLVWLAAHAAGVAVVQQFALVVMLPALVWTLLGRPVTWAIAFPLAYLFFAVPVGEFLIPDLQDFTTLFTVKALRLTGIPVFWEGRYISIPNGEFEVAEACSGLRYLIASLALGCLYAYLTYRSLWRRLAFIAISIGVPIVANGLRAYGIVMIAHLSQMRYAVGVDHLIYGWFFFGVVVLLMFWIGSFWREEHPERLWVTVPPLPTGVAGARPGALLPAAIASLAVAAIGPLGVVWLNAERAAQGPVVLQAPTAPAPWTGPLANDDSWEPAFVGADGVLHQVYRLDTRPVHLYIAFYRYQRQGAELINSANTLYDRQQWQYAGEDTRTVSLNNGERLRVQAIRLSQGARQRLIWQWYWVDGRTTASPMATKLLEAWDSLSRRERGSAVIAVAADYEIHPQEAEALLEQFLKAMTPVLAGVLERRP